MNELKKLGTSKFASEQSIQQKLSLLLESGVLHGIDHHGLYVQPSHTEPASLRNMLSTSLGYLLQPMYIFMIVLSFLTRPFTGVLVLVETWSSLTSTSSLTLDRPTWIQLVLLSSNVHLLPPRTNLLGLHTKSFLNLVTTGTRGCAHLRVLSVADFMFAASASYLGTKITIVHQNSEAFSCPLYADSLFCHLTIFKPPQFMLGAAKK